MAESGSKTKAAALSATALAAPAPRAFCVGPIAPEGAAGRTQVLGVPIDRSSSMG